MRAITEEFERGGRNLAAVLRDEGLADQRVGFERDYVSARDWALVDDALVVEASVEVRGAIVFAT